MTGYNHYVDCLVFSVGAISREWLRKRPPLALYRLLQSQQANRSSKLSRGPRRPIISKKEQQKKRAIVIELVSRIDILREVADLHEY